MTQTTNEMTAGAVESRDGTRIGYRKAGNGPAVVLVHGSMQSGRSNSLLAARLADRFTVYLPDRRGRGLSGPHKPDHGIATEVDDLAAVVAAAGAERVYGISAGGLVVLEAARRLPDLRKVAVFEPALLTDGTRHTAWLSRFDAELARGDVAGALVTSMYGLELAPAFLKVMPRRLVAALTDKMMRSEDRKAAPDASTMRRLAPTVHYEGVILAECADSADLFGDVRAEVLLMGGGKGLPFLAPARDALEARLPHCRRVEFPGLEHDAPSDPVGPSPRGKADMVDRVAGEIRAFF
ncbi:alpha/beta fold hydrolase [Asanoa iriomotensis]|uniref:AB hydrolase-1 domain-containing protein n=1 Tax=Asanoa iriomotensis TaxID=234613 RepID=A0ABQ4BUG9_9ACTN|nr:alpha/beta hydrolase [Asanoa iriomotensis]GIF54177.1 hypothetical protein Air01nite_02720 [Asanoa iriomotensis]